ncbi:CAP domain-containing protein [Nocardiopsis sp. NRRL B-16309]|uniref:CAP domain-containing protein n=1 Tax=Nocardiopsis sp. NRRL B-16309 TaxID=1519494 RepID=UPI0006AFCA6F|nr:CAP domain-containing protein [Nocardiopsis sp. NRRL B-16309]KOX24065.1 secretion protein [Nocardiopsis sp. NRRL B-16309]
MARGRRGKRRKSAHERPSGREGRRRLLPLAAGVAAVPVGAVLAGALLVTDPAERLNPFTNTSGESAASADSGVTDDAARAPEADDGADFFEDPTGTPRESAPAADDSVAAEVTASAAPGDEEDPEDTDGERGESGGGSGDGGGDSGGSGAGSGGGDGGGDDTLTAASSQVGRVVEIVNSERADEGCGSLRVDDRLTAAAQEHSEDMDARGYMAHESPEGEGPGDRAARHGYDAWGAENVAKGQRDAEQVMDAWMDSLGHRANILNCDLVAIGVGESGHAWTQMFGWE